MIKSIYKKSMTIPFIVNEDAFFTGIVARKALDLKFKNLNRKYGEFDSVKNESCFYL